MPVVVQDGATTHFLAGDSSYTAQLMRAGQIDGVSADDRVAHATIGAIRQFATDHPTIYLPTHDPESAQRLESRRFVR